MKKLLGVLIVLFLLAAVALALFLSTFDADRYRPVVIRKMEAALGRPVALEKISLRWRGGIAAELKGLAVEPSFRAAGVSVLLRPLPLLRGDIQIGDLQVQDGTVHLTGESLHPPLELTLTQLRLRASLDLRAQRLEIREASAKLGEGTISLNGTVRRFDSQAEGEFHLRLENIRIPVNLLREAFDRLTVIPGLTETLLARLPPSYAQKLTEKDTLLLPIEQSFTLESGVVTFPGLRVATDSFELAGSGRYNLSDSSIDLPAEIFIAPDLSGALVRSVEELKLLSDGQGRIVLPVRVGGTAQKPSVSPDLQAVTRKLFSGNAQNLIGDLLSQVLEKKKKK